MSRKNRQPSQHSEPIETIGTILTSHMQRDAIHVAILPVVAAKDLRPGEPVKLAYGTSDQAKSAEYGDALGVADPFLALRKNPTVIICGETDLSWSIRKGQRFWMFLRPGSVVGMRHHFVHPVIDFDKPAENEHELWLRQFADRWNFDYDRLIGAALAEPEEDNYAVARGIDLHGASELGPDHDLFWSHLAAMTRRQFDDGHKEKFTWSCSC